MNIGFLISNLFRKDCHHEISRRKRIEITLKNLLFSNTNFELRCWLSSAPIEYKHIYTFEEAVEKIDRSSWDGEGIFSTPIGKIIHNKSKVAYFFINKWEVLKVIKARKNAFYIGRYVLQSKINNNDIPLNSSQIDEMEFPARLAVSVSSGILFLPFHSYFYR